MSASVTIEDHTKEVKYAAEQGILVALEMIGLAVEGDAELELSKPKVHADGTSRPNVDTGRLRSSITHQVDGGNAHALASVTGGGQQAMATSTGEVVLVNMAGGGGDLTVTGQHSVAIGTNVEYAPYLELGTRRMPQGYPFLRPAVEKNLNNGTIRKAFEIALDKALKG